jgi:hypothetical protein
VGNYVADNKNKAFEKGLPLFEAGKIQIKYIRTKCHCPSVEYLEEHQRRVFTEANLAFEDSVQGTARDVLIVLAKLVGVTISDEWLRPRWVETPFKDYERDHKVFLQAQSIYDELSYLPGSALTVQTLDSHAFLWITYTDPEEKSTYSVPLCEWKSRRKQ